MIRDLFEKIITEIEATIAANNIERDAVLFYSEPGDINENPKLLIEKIQTYFEVFINLLTDIMFFESRPMRCLPPNGESNTKVIFSLRLFYHQKGNPVR